MSGFDADRTYSVRTQNNREPTGSALELPSRTEKLLLDFLLQYRVGSDFIYRFVYSGTRQSMSELTATCAETIYARTSF